MGDQVQEHSPVVLENRKRDRAALVWQPKLEEVLNQLDRVLKQDLGQDQNQDQNQDQAQGQNLDQNQNLLDQDSRKERAVAPASVLQPSQLGSVRRGSLVSGTL